MKDINYHERMAIRLTGDAICGITIWAVAIVFLLMVTGK